MSFRPRALLLIALLLGLATAPASGFPGPGDDDKGHLIGRGGMRPEDVQGPGSIGVDLYRPDGRTVKPALGGRVVMHLASQPPMLNFALDNSAVTRWILLDVHAALLRFNKETWKFDYDLATNMDIEDCLVLKGGRGEDNGNIVIGKVVEAGDHYMVTSGSRHNPIGNVRVDKSDVEEVVLGSVYTFDVREDALWHDGHPFDIDDVYFSWTIYKNPIVDCDEKRYKYHDDMAGCEVLGDNSIRFHFRKQYFAATDSFGFDFTVLPRHVYDLNDPDNADYAGGGVDPLGDEWGTYINENAANTDWVGLGPYEVVEFKRDDLIRARRFDSYWEKDPAKVGYMDELIYRYINNDNTAFQALLAGELDIFYRVKTEDYKGAPTQASEFVENFYKCHTYVGNVGYTSWNLYRPQFKDLEVRKALSMAFDVRDWIRTNYLELAVPVTGTMHRLGIGYNPDIENLEYDPDMAEELLAEAGWYDRDGDGIVDKDGQDLVIEALMPTGNKASERFLQKLQDSYGRIGVKVDIVALEWAQFLDKIMDRDFDACNLAWTLPTPESDPYQIWHGNEGAFDKRSSNHAGLVNAEVDALIERGRQELDREKRQAIWYELHEMIYDLHPYLFGWNVPRKIAINKKLYGVKLYNFEPGFSLRDMYYEEGTPGTRPLQRN